MEKRTKIIATISDRRCSADFIKKLHESGMDAVRINTAHQKPEDTIMVIRNVRKVSDRIGIILDTKGPELRTTNNKEDFEVKKGQRIYVSGDPDCMSGPDCIFINYKDFARDVRPGRRILIDDGGIELLVEKKEGSRLACRVMNSGIVRGRKGVNVPGLKISLPSLNKKDRDYISFAVKNGIEFIAHSFVRNKNDIMDIQKILDREKSGIKIIAKIENQDGVDNIDEILDHTYGIMVARGDLGLEIPAEKLPGIQKMIMRKCMERKKPVIVATQMLYSMIKSPRPTRAEVSDVANAIHDGADSLMLSGETSIGEYAVESVKTMARICSEVEKEREIFDAIPDQARRSSIPAFLAKTAVEASTQLGARAIIADTKTGRTGRYLAAFRGGQPIHMKCYSRRVMRELSISYGIEADYMKPRKTADQFIKESMKSLLLKRRVKPDDLIVILAGSFGPSYGASFIEISKARNITGGVKRQG